MPAFAEEVEAAEQEGVRIETLVAPIGILTRGGRLTGIGCIENTLGPFDAGGRRRPVPKPGTERTVPLDTLIVAISEGSDTDCVAVAGANRVATTAAGTVRVDPMTLQTNRPGVFAGGDVVRGPNTVVDAIADGKRAAVMIDRFLRGEPLAAPARPRLPETYVAPPDGDAEPLAAARVATPRLDLTARRRTFAEVEASLSEAEAAVEARRCLRCDLAFTAACKPEPVGAGREGGRS
jgi:NADPH-dependent glutamate synthase beta subunit-like oxidoreductase